MTQSPTNDGQIDPKTETVPANGADQESTTTDNRNIRRVLVVEDNDLNSKLFRDLLIAQGYGVIHTRDGVEAFRLARTHHPDLVLMDIQLHPPEVSGLEVTRWLQEDPALKNIPVIAITAFAMDGDEQRAKDAGCSAYLTKPISVRPFLETVASCIKPSASAVVEPG